jgi:hypothetical protein
VFLSYFGLTKYKSDIFVMKVGAFSIHRMYVLDVRTRFIENRHLTSINLSGVSGNGTAIVCMFTMYMCGAGYCLPGLKWVVKAAYTVCTRSLSTYSLNF